MSTTTTTNGTWLDSILLRVFLIKYIVYIEETPVEVTNKYDNTQVKHSVDDELGRVSLLQSAW
jgi:hypothetical protein